MLWNVCVDWRLRLARHSFEPCGGCATCRVAASPHKHRRHPRYDICVARARTAHVHTAHRSGEFILQLSGVDLQDSTRQNLRCMRCQRLGTM